MAQRILTLTMFLLRSLVFSLAGLLYFIAALVFWRLFFNPTKGTPETDYYLLVNGVFGASVAFLIGLTLAARAHRAFNYPLLVRLRSRVEHLTAVLISSVIFTLLVQGLVGLLALYRGPALTVADAFSIPPLWLAVDILAIVLALHASDLVASGWSRVVVFGLLAVFLFGHQLESSPVATGTRFTRLSSWFFQRGWSELGNLINRLGIWVDSSGADSLGTIFDILFWPFHAMIDAVIAGQFRPSQALAPAILLLYATVLFMLAADLFATKDLFLAE